MGGSEPLWKRENSPRRTREDTEEVTENIEILSVISSVIFRGLRG